MLCAPHKLITTRRRQTIDAGADSDVPKKIKVIIEQGTGALHSLKPIPILSLVYVDVHPIVSREQTMPVTINANASTDIPRDDASEGTVVPELVQG